MNVKKIIGVGVRWEEGISHNNKSKMLFDFLKEYDISFCDNFFDWKKGGDGDNGELLMYQLDEYFDSEFHKQHDAEIRKPLEDEISRLKKELDLKDKAHFENALKQLRETDYDTIRKIERLRVIAELEEWANTCYLVESIYEGIYCIDKDDLKQKLKEMKGEKRESNS